MHQADIKWLHLSDFHIGKDGYAQNQILAEIKQEISDEINKGFKPDFIFITGDIANKGRVEEYELFDKEFLIPVLEMLGTSYLDRVFLIPGNHDVDRRKAKSVRRYDVMTEIENFLDPTEEGRVEREELLSRFKGYDDYPWLLEQDKWVSSTRGYFAKRARCNNINVGVLCINTAWFCGEANEKEKLRPGVEMLKEGLREIDGSDLIFVLGHHPIDWFNSQDQTRFWGILAKCKAVYLHGHLHKTKSTSYLVGNTPVISLQAGCAFFARNDDIWVTRLLWGGCSLAQEKIYARPKKWSKDHGEWILDPDAFPNSQRVDQGDYWVIPRHSLLSDKNSSGHHSEATKQKTSPPEGWVLVDRAFIAERKQRVSNERLLGYFEGRIPLWEDILSGSIPSRTIVGDLIGTIRQGIDSSEPQLTLLLGAGGEGKSTAFLQTLEKLSEEEDVNILWRSNPEKGLPSSFVTAIAASGHTWLLASDEGDTMIKDTREALQILQRRFKIHFLLACRDTDWIDNGGNDTFWDQMARFAERRMKGLDETDARQIINAWAKFGDKGLGKLSGSTVEEAVSQLLEAARVEASNRDGAFLGAMLRVRMGAALRDHVASVLVRLETRNIVGMPGKTLLDAFALIAVPHSYNFLFLSKSVLAKAIGIDETKLRRRVIGPLGDEAAAAVSGQFILTRHRAIAEAAVEILAIRFDIDSEDILAELVQAAILASEDGSLVPQLVEWRYLSSRMFEQGNQSLGVKLAAAAVAVARQNSFLAVKLAQLYREAGQADQSVAVFRKTYASASGNRAFFTEWATCEGVIGNRATSIWLNAMSIADHVERRPPDAKDVGIGLAGCLVNFISLFERYQYPDFLSAAVAADRIARKIALPKAAFDEIDSRREALVDLNANFNVAQEHLFSDLLTGIMRAHHQREVDFTRPILSPEELEFEGLKEIARL